MGILFILLNVVCANAQRNAAFDRYITTHNQMAIEQERKYNIPASIKLAQAILESGAGTSYLAKEANNHFGIKCHTEWTGARAYKDAEIPNECFRKYNNIADSYEDHSKFLTERSRYARLFDLRKNDYKGWAKGLQEYGYATDKGYANKLINLIELYELYNYNSDSSPSGRRVVQTAPPVTSPPGTLPRNIYKTYGLIYVMADSNDSLEKIARDLGFKAKDLAKYNEIPIGFPLRQGDIVYLEKKHKMADKPHFYHTVQVGESMLSISQYYGMQLNSLYKLNKRKADYVPLEGDLLKLR
jgi:LysM repeat protein